MFEHLRRDIRRLETGTEPPTAARVVSALLFDNGFQAVLLYRLARWCKVRRIPILGAALARLNTLLTGAEISPSADIGPGLRVSHGVGLVVGGAAKIGADAILLHQVTLGSPSEGRVAEMPTVGDGVFIGAGAKLIGAIQVGDGAKIGVNAVVTRDVPAGARVRAAEPVE